MKNLFFFEKHPPLGKQLIAGVAHFAGYDGNYTFNKIGSEYTEVLYLIFISLRSLKLSFSILECSNILASSCASLMWKPFSTSHI